MNLKRKLGIRQTAGLVRYALQSGRCRCSPTGGPPLADLPGIPYPTFHEAPIAA